MGTKTVNDYDNEVNVLRMAILKRLSALSLGHGGQRVNIKMSSVDLPISPKVFQRICPIEYQGQEEFKATVSVSDLDDVFGKDWHIFNFPNSTTRKRIIGVILLHYRTKTLLKCADQKDR